VRRLFSWLGRVRDTQAVKRLSTNPLRLALFLTMLLAWAVVAAAGHVVLLVAFFLARIARGLGWAREWLYSLSNERIYLGLLILAVACVCWQGHLAEVRDRPVTYTIMQEQDSTFVAEIKQCCARQGWVWADEPRVHEVARRIYERSK